MCGRRRSRFGSLTCWLSLWAALTSASALARAEPLTIEMDLVLRDALSHDWSEPAAARNLFLHVEARDGVWQRVWGKAQNFGIGEHVGIVESSEVGDERVRLKIDLLVNGDFWVKGTWSVSYEVVLKRGTGGVLEGSYAGTFDGKEVAGRVEGRMPPQRRVRDGFLPPEPDEHPRLLFRRGDIPRLRKKLATPLGRAYREAVMGSGDPINLGVLYRLTGEASYAERAMQALKASYHEKIPVTGFGSGGFGHEIFKAAVTYDLCTSAWPKPFDSWVRRQLREFTERQQFVLMTSHANFHPCSNYYGPGRGVPGICSMVLWGAEGKEPPKPRDPLARTWQVRPPTDYTPGRGVVVTNLEADTPPASWIWTGPLPHESSRDVLNSIGGYADARPELGTTGTLMVKSGTWFKKAPFEFKALPADVAGEEGIDLDQAIGEEQPAVAVFFTAVRVTSQDVWGVLGVSEETSLWLSGVELEDDRFYTLHPGIHPLTVVHRSEGPTGVISPRLAPPTHSAFRSRMDLHAMEVALWEQDHALWEETGLDPALQLLVDRGWFQNFQHYRWGIGDGGFQAETGGYANISSWYPSVYASMYRNFFGRAVSPYPDVSHLIPRRMMQSVLGAGGAASAMKLNSVTGLDLRWMAAHYPIIPERYRSSALWAWNHLAGVSDESSIGNLLLSEKKKQPLEGITLAQTFVHYPLDRTPVHPSAGMPRTWRADTFGFYVFRSGWQGRDEFIAQVFLKASPIVGWNHPNAASFQLYGLGYPWTTSSESRNGVREQESVVLLPDDEIHRGSCGRLIHHEAHPDGSGSLTIDMNDVYAAPSPGLYDSMLVRSGEKRRPSGIEGLRAMAFDYSGKSGAPALMVLVDRIRGGGRKVWTWQRPAADVRVQDNFFSILYPDASLRGTFVTPADVSIEATSEEVEIGTARKGFHGTLNRIQAAGGDDFFVILTIQRGEAPQVTVDGEGLDAVVAVGKRTIRFDGNKIRLGDD